MPIFVTLGDKTVLFFQSSFQELHKVVLILMSAIGPQGSFSLQEPLHSDRDPLAMPLFVTWALSFDRFGMLMKALFETNDLLSSRQFPKTL